MMSRGILSESYSIVETDVLITVFLIFKYSFFGTSRDFEVSQHLFFFVAKFTLWSYYLSKNEYASKILDCFDPKIRLFFELKQKKIKRTSCQIVKKIDNC